MGDNQSYPKGCPYRASLEGMYNHLHDDASEQILPEGVPATAAVTMYCELAQDTQRIQEQFDDAGARFFPEQPAGYQTAPVKKKEARRSLWDILNTPLQHLFGGQHGK